MQQQAPPQHQQHNAAMNTLYRSPPASNGSQATPTQSRETTGEMIGCVAQLRRLKQRKILRQQQAQSRRALPIRGKAIFNNTLVQYLCDGGADKTVISRATFDRIRGEEPLTQLEPYSGGQLRSASGPIEVHGETQLRQCVMTGQ